MQGGFQAALAGHPALDADSIAAYLKHLCAMHAASPPSDAENT